MATKNAINNKSQELTVDPGASGDSFVQFDINGTGEFRIGVDDDAADSFKVSQGSALGVNDTFIMTADGERTMPLQSAFLAYLGTTDSNVTGDATVFNLGTGNALTEVFDQNGDFTTGGIFTAPVTGRYYLQASFLLADVVAQTLTQLLFTTSNSGYYCFYSEAGTLAAADDQYLLFGEAFVDMDAADTAVARVNASGSTKTVDVISTNRDTRFAGYLVC